MIKQCFKATFLILISFLWIGELEAQYYLDGLRYAQQTFGGTARIQALGGASVALGGDLSSGMINPAGLGFNRKSEISITPGLGFNNTNTTYSTFPNNEVGVTDDSRFNFNIASLGVVFSKARNGISSNYGGSFSISVNRINNFNNSISYSGINDSTQIFDALLQEASGIPWSDFDEQGESGFYDYLGLAYYNYLIEPDLFADPQNFNEYTTPIAPPRIFPSLQQENITTRGGQYQWDFSYGGNYDDRIYYGAGIGIQTLNYEREREYSETVDNPDSPFRSAVFFDQLNQSGLGVNLKAGIIIRATDRIRIGLNAVSPTWFRVVENFEENVFTEWSGNATVFRGFDSSGEPEFGRPEGNRPSTIRYDEISFSLKTPGRISGGLAYFIGKNGFISADVEYINYAGTTMNNPRFTIDNFDAGFDFEGDNQTIKDIYSNVFNFRTGAEFRKGIFRFRGGFALYGNPFGGNATGIQIKTVNTQQGNVTFFESTFNNVANRGFARYNYTGGLGLRKSNFYADFAVVVESYYSHSRPYSFANLEGGAFTNPTATVNQSRVRALFSFGFFY